MVSCLCVLVEGVSALVAEFVGVAVLDVFLAAVGALVDLVHTRQIDELCVSTIGAVVLGEELVEHLHDHVNPVGYVLGHVTPLEFAVDSDGEVALVGFVAVAHGSEVFVDECVQEKLVLNLVDVLVAQEKFHHFGDLNYEVGVHFAFSADAEEIVLSHVSVC